MIVFFFDVPFVIIRRFDFMKDPFIAIIFRQKILCISVEKSQQTTSKYQVVRRLLIAQRGRQN